MLRAADGTNRFLIEARVDQYTTLSNNIKFCQRYKRFKKLQKREFVFPAFLHNRLSGTDPAEGHHAGRNRRERDARETFERRAQAEEVRSDSTHILE